MKLKETTQYAVRVIIYLSLNKNSVVTIQQISNDTHISAKYLAKILNTLKMNELVIGIRGCDGGYKLNPAKTKISLYDVVHAIEKEIDAKSEITIFYDQRAKNKINEINTVYARIQSSLLEQLQQLDLLS